MQYVLQVEATRCVKKTQFLHSATNFRSYNLSRNNLNSARVIGCCEARQRVKNKTNKLFCFAFVSLPRFAEFRDTSGIFNTTQREIWKAATIQKNQHTKKMVINSQTWYTFHFITKTQTIVAAKLTTAFSEEVSTNHSRPFRHHLVTEN